MPHRLQQTPAQGSLLAAQLTELLPESTTFPSAMMPPKNDGVSSCSFPLSPTALLPVACSPLCITADSLFSHLPFYNAGVWWDRPAVYSTGTHLQPHKYQRKERSQGQCTCSASHTRRHASLLLTSSHSLQPRSAPSRGGESRAALTALIPQLQQLSCSQGQEVVC